MAGIADLLAKRAILATFAPGERRSVIGGLLSLTYIQNRHGAMGLFPDRPVVLVALATGVVILLAFVLRGSLRRSRLGQVGFGLLLGGAVGNVVDRLIHGFVIDFVALRGFYVFNLADACITAGLVLLALGTLRTPAR